MIEPTFSFAVYELLLKYGAKPRPEKSLTPPPEPEPVEPPKQDEQKAESDGKESQVSYSSAIVGSYYKRVAVSAESHSRAGYQGHRFAHGAAE